MKQHQKILEFNSPWYLQQKSRLKYDQLLTLWDEPYFEAATKFTSRAGKAWASDLRSICAPHFIKFGHFLIDMWHVNDFKIVCHLGFSKFTVYVTWPILACNSASYCKNLLKSDDRLLSYVEKRFRRWQPSAILNFKSFNFWSCGCHQI